MNTKDLIQLGVPPGETSRRGMEYIARYILKHEVNHDMDTHMFSVEDAVLAYLVSRKLGEALYPLAKLKTRFPAGLTKRD